MLVRKSSALPNRVSICCTFSEKIGITLIPDAVSVLMTPVILSKVQNEPVMAIPMVFFSMPILPFFN
jgi:hypothetical protein